MDVNSPGDGSVPTTIPRSTAAGADHSIHVARRAFVDGRWSAMAPAARKKVRHKWADPIDKHAPALAVLGVRNNDTEISMALKAEPLGAAQAIPYYAEALDKVYGEIAPTGGNTLGMIHKTPVGVVGAIIPWNFSLMIGAWKLRPALAAGCTVVAKPSETASLTLIRIAELALEAGLPAGVLNVVTSEGAVVGAAIAESMHVDVLSFTGSGTTGPRLMEASTRSNMIRIYLKLGSKSPNIIFADAPDLEKAAKVSAAGIFRNSGQVCVAGSRLPVERAIEEEFTAELMKAADAMTVGDPLDLRSTSGAVNSARQSAQNLAFVAEARSAGRPVHSDAQLFAKTGGFYMAPAIISKVLPTDRLFREEVFGPMLAVTPFDAEEEALKLANGTEFGPARAPHSRKASSGCRACKHLWRRGWHCAVGRGQTIRQRA